MSELEGLEFFEAELLHFPQMAHDIEKSEGLRLHPSTIEIKRDSSFDITLELKGVADPRVIQQDPPDVPLGTVSEARNIEATTKFGSKIRIVGYTPAGDSLNTGNLTFTGTAHASSVTEESQPSAIVASSALYLLGFPDGMPPRGTRREFTGEYVLERTDTTGLGQFGKINRPWKDMQRSVSSDSLLIQTKFGSALFSKGMSVETTKALNPSYLHFVAGKAVLDNEERRIFLEAVNFCFGKRFVEVGNTEFDSDFRHCRRTARRPYSINLRREAAAISLPPTNLLEGYGFINEKICSEIVELFLEKREQFSLSTVMWNVWTARQLPLGVELLSYAAALEALVNAWADENPSTERALYVPSAEFTRETKSAFDSLRKSAPSSRSWEKILGRLEHLNKATIADKRNRFFDTLGMKTGPVEEAVIGARHKFAHGGAVDSVDVKRLVVIARAYEALINRSLLKVLGFSGMYRDYSTKGFPLRDLSEPLGGPENDGKI